MLIAYFCAEFALIDDMPSYAGGLGILAGDYMLQAADDGFPIVGVSLYYQKGQNTQLDSCLRRNDRGSKFGLKLVRKNWRERLLIEIPIEERTVLAQVWQWRGKNNTSVYFLDTNIKENTEADRKITEQLYAEDRDLRLKQELVLGIGGVRLLRALNIAPTLYHLNEGHSAFLCLELLSEKIKTGLNLEPAVAEVRKKIVFTNHTLVLEGQELFAFDALVRHTEKFCHDSNVNITDFYKLGLSKSTDTLFSMTALALNLASLTNAVSRLHGEKARELWPNYPIIHITNGIYLPRWDKVGSKDLIKTHEKNEKELLKLIRQVRGDNWKKEALLVGWSRRFVPYKRPMAILEDAARLKKIAEHFAGKIHLVYSAPLSEAEAKNNIFLKRLFELMNGDLKGLITFIPNYRIEVAEKMVAGCDIWLNTPIVGREACGTSGMKAALNGTINVSTNDGWIAEIPLNHYGWIVDDERITDSLLDTLEKKVLPVYESGVWHKYMKKSRQAVLTNFSTKRMLREYREKLYQPVIDQAGKKLIAFDVDGTLSEPRQEIDRDMADLVKKLLQNKRVAIISGGAFEHIKKQVLDPLSRHTAHSVTEKLFKNLILLPTNGGGFYTFSHDWKEISSHKLTPNEKAKIISAIKEIVAQNKELQTPDNYGAKIQDREAEITYSALGEKAPVDLKANWDADFKKRILMQTELVKRLPEFEVKIGGTTSIDITPKGMDKAYGIKQLLNYFKFDKKDITFVGDAIYPNGNDYPVSQLGVESIKVSGPSDTKKVIKKILGY